MKAEVRVSKAAQGGKPLVQVAIHGKATPEEIGTAIRGVYGNPSVYVAGGIRECLTCKSGIHVEIVDSFPEAIIVDSK